MNWYRLIWSFGFVFSVLAQETPQNCSETFKKFYDQFGISVDSERGALFRKELDSYLKKKNESKKRLLLQDCLFPARELPFFIK